ncbi:TPA: oligosaccharide flippase family protein [Providencia rettgeri]|nr:oligosaccharide flippase family protein [Providencia rettgeri]
MKVLKNKLISAGLIQAISFFVSGIFQLAIIFLFSKFFPSSVVGFISIISIINMFCLSMAESGIYNFVVYKKTLTKELFVSLQTFISIISFSIFIIMVVIIIYYPSIGKIEKTSIIIALTCIPIISLGSIQYAVLMNEYKFTQILVIETIFRSSQFFILLTLIKLNLDYIYIYPIALLASYVLRLLTITAYTHNHHYITYSIKRLSRNDTKDFFRFYTSQFGSNAINTFSSKIDEIIIASFINLASLGQYFIVKQVVIQLLSAIFILFRRIFMPILSSNKGKNSIYLAFKKQFRFIVMFILILNISFFLITNVFKHSNNSGYIELFTVVFTIFSMKSLSANFQCAYYQVIGKPLIELYWNMIQAVVLCLSFFLVAYFSFIDSIYTMLIFLFITNLTFYITSYFILLITKKSQSTLIYTLAMLILSLLFLVS